MKQKKKTDMEERNSRLACLYKVGDGGDES